MTFILTATSTWDAPEPTTGVKITAAEVFFDLDDGLVPLETEWIPNRISDHVTAYVRQTTFKAQVPQTFEFRVRLNQFGQFRIGAGLQLRSQGALYGDSQSLYLLVTATGTQIQGTPFPAT